MEGNRFSHPCKQMASCIIFLIILTMSISCQDSPSQITPQNTDPQPTFYFDDPTASPSPPAPTLTSTNALSPTGTESLPLTFTLNAPEPALQGTPIAPAAEINLENMAQLNLLAFWGKGSANSSALSADGALFAVAAPAGVFIFETDTFSEMLHISPPAECLHLLFLPDNEHLILGLINGQAVIYQLKNGEPVQTFQTDFQSDPYLNAVFFNMALKADEQQLILYRPINNLLNIRVETWDINSGERLAVEELPYDLGSTYDPDRQILLISQGLNLTYYNLSADTQTTHNIQAENGSRLQSDAGNPFLFDAFVILDQDTVLFTTHHTFGVLDLQNDQPIYVVEDFPPYDSGLCKNRPSAETCLIPGSDPAMGDTGRECGDGPGASNLYGLFAIPEEDLVIFSLQSGTMQGRSISDGSLIWEIKSQLRSKKHAPNQDFFIGLTDTGQIQKRRLSDGTLVDESPPQFYGLLDTAISPDSTLLAVAGTDKRLQLLSLADGEPLATFDLPAQTLAFSPDGQTLAIELGSGELYLLSIPDQELSRLSDRHLDFIHQLAFSEDGSTLISGSQDCSARVWDVAQRDLIRTLQILPSEAYLPFPLVINHVGIIPSICEDCYYMSGKEAAFMHIYQGENLLYEIDASGSLIHLTTTNEPVFLVFNHETKRLQLKDDKWEFLGNVALSSDQPAISPDHTFLLELASGAINGWRLPDLEMVASLPLPLNLIYTTTGFNSYREIQISPNQKTIIFAHQYGFIMIFGFSDP